MRNSDYISFSDHELLNRMRLDDSQAFTEIYARYSESLFARAKTILQRSGNTADIVQQAFLSLWQRRKVAQIEHLGNYLHQSVRFLVFQAIKDGKAQQKFFDRVSQASHELLFTDPLLFKELQSLIPEIMHGLPADQQRIFRMHREQQMTYQQIAEELNISIKTVEKKMSLALKSFRIKTNDLMFAMVLLYMVSEP